VSNILRLDKPDRVWPQTPKTRFAPVC
jgi:hypothetical protein